MTPALPKSPDANTEELMTIKETAAYLRIPLPTAYYLVQRGQLPAVQIGGRWRIKRSLLNRDILKAEVPTVKNVVLKIENAANRALVTAALRNTPTQITDTITESEDQTIITDGNIKDQLGDRMASYRGQVVTLVSDESNQDMGANIVHYSPMTFIFTRDLGNPTKGIRRALNLPLETPE